MKNTQALHRFIKIKIIMRRQREYFGYLQLAMIAYLFFEKVGFSYWYLLLVPVWIVWAYFDITQIFGKELDYIYKKSSVLKEIWQRDRNPFVN